MFFVADRREAGPLVWSAVLQLCFIYGAVFCVSAVVLYLFFHYAMLVLDTESGDVLSVLLCRTAHGFGIRRCIHQGVAVGTGAFAGDFSYFADT